MKTVTKPFIIESICSIIDYWNLLLGYYAILLKDLHLDLRVLLWLSFKTLNRIIINQTNANIAC